MKKRLLFVVSFVLSISGFSQVDKLIESGEKNTSPLTRSTQSSTADRGKNLENGIFFTKSSYETQKSSNLRSLSTNASQLSKTFQVYVDGTDNYFFAAHVLPANNVEKIISENANKDAIDLTEIRVYVNEKQIGTLKTSKLEWELVPLKETAKVALLSGENTIRFESDAPYYPDVDAVRIAKSANDLLVENKGYNDFVNQLKATSSANSNLRSTKSSAKMSQDEVDKLAREIESSDNSSKLKSALLPGGSYEWQVTPISLNNPSGTYAHRMLVPITFTYYRKLSLAKGTYTFHTTPVGTDSYTAVDPVMYLYKIDDPHNYSYYNDDYTNYHPRIQATVPAGDYYLVLRAYSGYYASTSLGRQGLVNVYQNGVLLNSNMPVAGYMFDVDNSNTGTINYFTSYTTGIPNIWLQQNSTKQMKFMGGQFFYADPMDWMWWDDARMRLTKPSSTDRYSMMISAEGAMSFYFGNCDAYGSAASVDANVLSSFPNLKNNDAIKSANSTTTYNCTAWTGGLTNGWFWGSLYASSSGSYIGLNYGSPYVWSTWDNYYGNIPARYSGAVTYTKEQADAYNGVIAMWSTNGEMSGVTHGSIRLDGNNHPHGYAWESKAGQLCRFFHPRDALSGSGYGSIFAYYRDASKDPYPEYYYNSSSAVSDNTALALRSTKRQTSEPVFTFDESVEAGLTVVEDVQLDAEQKQAVTVKTKSLRSVSQLETLYNKWVAKINSEELAYISNPYTYIEIQEGLDLISFAKQNMKEAIVFFADKIFDNDESKNFEKNISYYLFSEIAKDQYGEVIESIKSNWEENNYNQSGSYIAPMPETFTKKYIKALLDKEVLNKSAEIITAIDKAEVDINNDKLFTIAPNPIQPNSTVNINLPEDATISLIIYGQSNSIGDILVNTKNYSAGTYKFSIDLSKLNTGINYCILKINGKSYARKILKR